MYIMIVDDGDGGKFFFFQNILDRPEVVFPFVFIFYDNENSKLRFLAFCTISKWSV